MIEHKVICNACGVKTDDKLSWAGIVMHVTQGIKGLNRLKLGVHYHFCNEQCLVNFLTLPIESRPGFVIHKTPRKHYKM